MLCTEYIKCLLENKKFNIIKNIKELKSNGGEKFFDAIRGDIFPERDFYLCTEVNRFDFVLKFEYDNAVVI